MENQYFQYSFMDALLINTVLTSLWPTGHIGNERFGTYVPAAEVKQMQPGQILGCIGGCLDSENEGWCTRPTVTGSSESQV